MPRMRQANPMIADHESVDCDKQRRREKHGHGDCLQHCQRRREQHGPHGRQQAVVLWPALVVVVPPWPALAAALWPALVDALVVAACLYPEA